MLADEQLTRRHWQILATLAQGEASPRRARRGARLVRRDRAAAARRLDPPRLGDRVTRAGAGRAAACRSTAVGRAAHDRVAERVRSFRPHVTDGLSEREYATLIALLERVTGNLTPA